MARPNTDLDQLTRRALTERKQAVTNTSTHPRDEHVNTSRADDHGYIREELLCSGASYSEELLSHEPFLIVPLGCRYYRLLKGPFI